MFGFSLIRTAKLLSIYEKMAIFAIDKVRHQHKFNMTISGIVTNISPIQSGTSKSGKSWRKIDVVLTYDNSKPEYPKAIVFSVMNDNIEKFNLCVGSEYDIEVDFSVREYNGKNYMSANAWKATAKNVVSPTASSMPAPAPQGWQATYPTPQPQPVPQPAPQANDDLPF